MSFKCLSIEGLWHLFHHCKRDSNSFLNISLAKSLQCLTFYTDPPLPSPLDQWRGPGPGPADRCKLQAGPSDSFGTRSGHCNTGKEALFSESPGRTCFVLGALGAPSLAPAFPDRPKALGGAFASTVEGRFSRLGRIAIRQ